MKGKWNQDYFNNKAAITLELGCGKGEYTIALAEKNPEKVLHLLKLLDDIVQKGRSTPGEALSNDREVSFLPKGVMLPAKK